MRRREEWEGEEASYIRRGVSGVSRVSGRLPITVSSPCICVVLAPQLGEMRIAASKVAGCVGKKSRYEKCSEAWLSVLHANFGYIMREHGTRHRALKLRKDRVDEELRALPVELQRGVRKVFEESVASSSNDAIPQEALPVLSEEAVQELQRTVKMTRGLRQEGRGLELHKLSEVAVAETCASSVRLAHEKLADAEATTVRRLTEIAGDESLGEEDRAEKTAFVQRELSGVKRQTEETIVTATKRLKLCHAPLTQQLSLQSSLGAEGEVCLMGKVDAVKATRDTITIVEHKRRQSRIFDSVPLYERLQCLAYIHLVEESKSRLHLDLGTNAIRPHCTCSDPDACLPLADVQVKCLLVETMLEEENETEIHFEKDRWDETCALLVDRARELKRALTNPESLVALLETYDDDAGGAHWRK